MAVTGAVSFLLAPQLPYLVEGAVRPGLAASLSVVAGAGLALLGVRSVGGSIGGVRLAVWSVLAVGLWLPAAHAPWRPFLAPLVQIVAAVALVGIALALRRGRGASPENGRRWPFLACATAVLVLAELGRGRFAAEAVQPWWALAWALLVLVALVGWGRLVANALLPGARVDWGLAGALGLAVACAGGGVANLAWAISPLTVELFLALGAAAWVFSGSGERAPTRASSAAGRLHPVIAVALVALVALQLAGAVAGTVDTVYERPALDRHDDAQAYMVFPRSMLEIGSIGPQPWEARRMLSMGAQSGLQALILVANPPRAVHLLDAGLALVLLFGLALGAARSRALGPSATLLVLAVVLTAPHIAMRGNTSAVITGAVLLLALFRLLDDAREEDRWSSGGLVLVVAAAIAVKSTLAPVAVVAAGVGLLAPAVTTGRRARNLAAGAGAAAAVFLLVLPWMVSILESSGTLLYPVFGRGFYGGVYDAFHWAEGSFEIPLAFRIKALLRHGIPLLPVLVLLAVANDRRPRRAAAAIGLAATAALVALVLLGDPRLNRSIARYAFPPILAAELGLLTVALARGGARWGRAGTAVAVAVALLLTLGRPAAVVDLYGQLVRNLSVAAAGASAATNEERQAMIAVEEAVPGDGLLLATLQNPWLLDPKRHRVRILSLPGMSSPPPGLPLDRGPEALAATLERQGVRYLAYGGRRQLGDLLQLTEEHIRDRYPHSRMRWAILRGHERYRGLVDGLAGSRKRLYDDGRRIVLDLAVRASTVVPARSPGRCDGFLEGDWTTGDAVIRGLRAPSTPAFVILRSAGRHPAWHGDPSEVGVTVDDLRLPAVESRLGRRVYRLASPPPGRFALRIRSAAIAPSELGARPDGPALGVDVAQVEVVADPRLASTPIRTLVQAVRGELEVERIWRREGFYPDHGWTDGDGVLEGLEWPVGPGQDELELELYPAHPEGDRPELLDIHVSVDGLDLEPVELLPRLVRFRLPPGHGSVHSIRIRSRTFVPSERGPSRDDRTLGVPVRRLALRTR
jgi:hypothetical protein